MWGLSTKCPSCKNMFAEKVLSSYKQPSSTYSKRINLSNNMSRTEVYEIGTSISENQCSVCGHQWTTRKNYKELISGGPGQYD